MLQSLIEFKDRFREQLLLFLWRQWDALGVQGYEESNDRWVIDPESLLLFSCTMARYDSRLFDEILDWLYVNGDFINVQRLQTILKKEEFSSGVVISSVAGFMSEHHKYLKWEKLSQNYIGTTPVENLFLLNDIRSDDSINRVDPIFQKYGLSRGLISLRKHTQPVRGDSSRTLLFKLRALLGVNIRCEILLFLLTHQDGAHPKWIANETCYSQKAVQDTLIDMTYSGLIQVFNIGREKRYLLKPNEWFSFLKLSGDNPPWVSWPSIFSTLEKIWVRLNQGNFQTIDPLLLSSNLRSLMLEVRGKIQLAGFAPVISDDRLYLGENYTNIFMRDINEFLKGSK